MSEDIVATFPYSRVVGWSEEEQKTERAALDARTLVAQHYLAFRHPLLRYVRWRVRSEADAEELTQEVFLRLYLHVRAGHHVINCRAWLFAVARNAIADRRREYRAEAIHVAPMPTDVPSSVEGVDERFERLCRTAMLDAAIATLPALQRECMALRANGMRLREVADTLGCTISTVASSLQRAIVNIRRRLNDEAGEQPRPR